MWPRIMETHVVTSDGGKGESGPGEGQGTLPFPRAWGPAGSSCDSEGLLLRPPDCSGW